MVCMLKASLISQHIRLMELAPCPIRQLSWRLLAAPHFTVVLTVGCCWGQKAKSLAQLSIREINMSLSRVCLHFLIQDIIRAALHMSILFQNCFTIRKTIHYSICIAT